MGLSLPHLIVLALVVLLLFGRGKISELMGDFGKGIKSFKAGIADETTDRPVTPPPAQIPPQASQPAPSQQPAQPAPPQATR
jgi:sec-independent protein translocase protein TatA